MEDPIRAKESNATAQEIHGGKLNTGFFGN
jgi:hypothetical protein